MLNRRDNTDRTCSVYWFGYESIRYSTDGTYMQFSFVRGDDPSVGRGIFAMGKRGSNVLREIAEAEGSEECEEKSVRN